MHLQSCINPQTIWNPYLKELQVVPCGKCAACINRKASIMVTRLNVESQCHPYTLFVTLTYDNEHLPVLRYNAPYLTDLSPFRVHPKLGVFTVNVEEELHKIHTSREDNNASYAYIKRCQETLGGLPYLPSVDVQRFMKRLRSMVLRQFKKSYHNEKSFPKIRYYAAGEFGPTNYRSHWHILLFIDSEWLAQNLVEYVRSCWQFGFVDSSFVEHNASDYVAKYLSCVSDLPAIYQTGALRPFALYSKHPALGTLVYYSEDLRKLFLSGTLYQTIFVQKQSIFKNVPFWRTIQYKLYPRISFFDFIDSGCLCRLYSQYERYAATDSVPSFFGFRKFIESAASHGRNEYIKTYLDLLASYKGDYEKKLQRFYLVTRQVSLQASAWNIPVKDYVLSIIKYYNEIQKTNLRSWFQFAEEYSQQHDCSQLLSVDPLFFRQFADCDLSELTVDEIYYIQSFGIDLDKFFSDDPTVRLAYQSQFYSCNSQDFMMMKASNERILNNSTKTKKKNDYQNSEADWYRYILTFGLDGQKRNIDDFDNNSLNVLPKVF